MLKTVLGQRILYKKGIFMTDIWQKLKETTRPVVLYGMGNGAEIMMKQLEKCGVSVSGFFASDG